MNGVIEVLLEPIGYYRYSAKYFVINFNHKFKDLTTKKDLLRMCYKPSMHKFYLWYEKICNLDLTYKEWLEWGPLTI